MVAQEQSDGGVIIYQTRTHKGQVKCYPCSYQGKRGRGSSANSSSSCSFDADSRRTASRGSEGWHRPWACTTPWHRLAFCGNHYRNENINDVKMLCPCPGPGSVTAATFIIGNPIITASDCNIINKQLYGPFPLQYMLKVHPYGLILAGQFFLFTSHFHLLFLAC